VSSWNNLYWRDLVGRSSSRSRCATNGDWALRLEPTVRKMGDHGGGIRLRRCPDRNRFCSDRKVTSKANTLCDPICFPCSACQPAICHQQLNISFHHCAFSAGHCTEPSQIEDGRNSGLNRSVRHTTRDNLSEDFCKR